MKLYVAALLSVHLSAGGNPHSDDGQCMRAIQGNGWVPIRVKYMFSGKGIESSESANLRNNVLPQLKKYLESALSIRDRSDRVHVRRRCLDYQFGLCVQEDLSLMSCEVYLIGRDVFGALDVYDCPPGAKGAADCSIRKQYKEGTDPLSGGDLFLLFSSELTPSCKIGPGGKPRVRAYAGMCSTSACGRPNIATVNVCKSVTTDEDLTQTLLHEIMHTLGFSFGGNMYGWIDANGKKQVPNDKQFRLIIESKAESDGSKRLKLLKSIPALGKHTGIQILGIPYHVVKSIDARGFGKSSTCPCPIDPNSSFTESQLTKCLLEDGLKDCVFVVKSPNVVKYARNYYSCESLEGMELENQRRFDGNPNVPWTMFNSHWKYKNLQGELMNSVSDDGLLQFISPMTLALLEDSGWYRVNYAAAGTSLVEGVTFGYHSGCGFLKDKCVDKGKFQVKLPQFPNAFKLREGRAGMDLKCSPDGLFIQMHTDEIREKLIAPIPSQYRYEMTSDYRLTDYCPSYVNYMSCAIVTLQGGSSYDYSNRCFETVHESERIGVCGAVRCLDNASLELHTSKGEVIGTCSSKGQELTGKNTYYCPDPKVVCAKLSYPHLPASSINTVPKRIATVKHITDPPKQSSSKVHTTKKIPTTKQETAPIQASDANELSSTKQVTAPIHTVSPENKPTLKHIIDPPKPDPIRQDITPVSLISPKKTPTEEHVDPHGSDRIDTTQVHSVVPERYNPTVDQIDPPKPDPNREDTTLLNPTDPKTISTDDHIDPLRSEPIRENSAPVSTTSKGSASYLRVVQMIVSIAIVLAI